MFLVQLGAEAADAAAGLSQAKATLLQLVEHAPDGFVVIDAAGRVISANAAFLELAQLASEEAARGESLDRWLGREGVDLDVLTANLRQRGAIRLFATVMRGGIWRARHRGGVGGRRSAMAGSNATACRSAMSAAGCRSSRQLRCLAPSST